MSDMRVDTLTFPGSNSSLPLYARSDAEEPVMARSTTSVSGKRSARKGSTKRRNSGKVAARRAREGASVKRGTARRRGTRHTLEPKGWTIRFASGETFPIEADSVAIDSSGTVTFSLSGKNVLFVSPNNYTFIMEASEPLNTSVPSSDSEVLGLA
jgi:hypothetical protein